MAQAYQRLGESDVPKFTVIVAQKNHHTKLFKAKGPENVPAGKKIPFILHQSHYDSISFQNYFIIKTIPFVRNCCGHQDRTPDKLRFLHVCSCRNNSKFRQK